MPVPFVLVAVFFPRVVLFFAWFAAPGPLEYVFGGTALWLLLGLVFLPITTLVYAFQFDPMIGSVHGTGLAAVGVAALVVLAVIGVAARARGAARRSAG